MKTKNKQTLSWLNKHSKKYYPYIIINCVVSTVVSLSFVFLALISKQIIDISAGVIEGDMLSKCIILFAIITAQIILNIVNSNLLIRAECKLDIHFKAHLFSAILNKKYSEISHYHSGDLLNRLSSDISVVVNNVATIIPNAVALISKLIASGIALYLIADKMVFVILAVGIVVPLIGRLLSSKYKYLHKLAQQADGTVKSYMQEAFENVAVIKTFPSVASVKAKLDENLQYSFWVRIKRFTLHIVTHAGLYSLFTFGYYILLVWGAFNLGNGISYGTLVAFLEIAAQLRAPMQQISGILPQYYSMMASAERLIELENIQDEPKCDANQPTEFDSLVCENVTFKYESSKENVIENTSLTINKGTITTIMGASGSGKSTLFKLILGLLEPNGGKILINGRDISGSVNHLFAYVPQGSMILSGTIKENLTLCREDISEDEIISATKTAEIYDFIVGLPKGFDTIIGERGEGLSEGQVQRLSIARALLCDSPVLLLDESTSALDEATEEALLTNIKQLTDKTVIFITHRNHCLDICDKVLIFKDKRFIEK